MYIPYQSNNLDLIKDILPHLAFQFFFSLSIANFLDWYMKRERDFQLTNQKNETKKKKKKKIISSICLLFNGTCYLSTQLCSLSPPPKIAKNCMLSLFFVIIFFFFYLSRELILQRG